MKRLGMPLLLSLLIHGLLLAPWLVWEFLSAQRPLAGRGGGGGRGVTVEIVGSGEPAQSSKPASVNNKTSTIKTNLEPRASSRQRRITAPSHSSPPLSQQASLSGPGSGPGAPGAGSGPEGGTNTVLAEIRARVERAKRYPLFARQSGITGTAWVRFQINGSGQPQNIELQKTSGQKILDDEALATIRRGAPYPSYEETLAIGIRFELKDD